MPTRRNSERSAALELQHLQAAALARQHLCAGVAPDAVGLRRQQLQRPRDASCNQAGETDADDRQDRADAKDHRGRGLCGDKRKLRRLLRQHDPS
jgi:hypothetical protein